MGDDAKYQSLVLAVASGGPVSAWCRKHNMPRSLVAEWQTKPAFASDVQACRRQILERAVGKFLRSVNRAARGMVEQAASARSRRAKLAADQTLFKNLVQLSEFAVLIQRVDELEARIKENKEHDDGRPRWKSRGR